jgi:hypothetical protein
MIVMSHPLWCVYAFDRDLRAFGRVLTMSCAALVSGGVARPLITGAVA